MFKRERQKAIIELLEKHESIRVNSLAQHFNVSEMTIRRDLDDLEQTEMIRRTRGGATGRKILLSEKDFDQRKVERLYEKQKIAKQAITFMEAHDTILLDYGSTPQELAKMMVNSINFNLTVVINDFYIYSILKKNPLIHLIFAGGAISTEENHITLGALTNHFYQQIQIDKAFMSMRTIDFNKGLFHPNSQIAELKRTMIDSAKEVIVIADHSKFNNHSMFKIVPISKVDILITDDKLDNRDLEVPQDLKFIKC